MLPHTARAAPLHPRMAEAGAPPGPPAPSPAPHVGAPRSQPLHRWDVGAQPCGEGSGQKGDPLLAVPASWHGEERPRGDTAGGHPAGSSGAPGAAARTLVPTFPSTKFRATPGISRTSRLPAGSSLALILLQQHCHEAGTGGTAAPCPLRHGHQLCQKAAGACSSVARERPPGSQHAPKLVFLQANSRMSAAAGAP